MFDWAQAAAGPDPAAPQAAAEGGCPFVEVTDSGQDGDLAYWSGVLHAGPGPAARITEIYRRSAGAWRLVHRHETAGID
ncbi:MAG: hypothetical protein KDK26_09770 [Roseivivax sp.]|nr:hypothetical protein [Roseivivax sp.]